MWQRKIYIHKLLVDCITKYHVNKYKRNEGAKKKGVLLHDNEVKRFTRKATVRFINCSHMRQRKGEKDYI